MFQLPEMTMATINSVTPRVEKHGDDDKPAVSIKLSIEGPNTLLDAIDPQIRLALYKPKDDEPTLPGVEVSTPVLRCNAFEKHTLTASHEGMKPARSVPIYRPDQMRAYAGQCTAAAQARLGEQGARRHPTSSA